MLDIIPWFDETYLVEMGRLFLCGGDADSILLSRSGVIMMPLNYICPLIQECAFRLFGEMGVRISPFIGWILGWLCLRRYNKVAGLFFLTSPLIFQSAILARPDTWALLFSCGALAVLGKPDAPRGKGRIFFGSFLAVLSVFAWPSSIMTGLMYPAFCFNTERKREFLFFCLGALVSAALLVLPLLPHLNMAIAAFSQHSQDTAPRAASVLETLVTLAKEFARSPFVFSIGLIGLVVWMRQRRFVAILALCFGLAVGIKTSMYVFRIIYLVPLWMLLCADAVAAIGRVRPRLAHAMIGVAITYGIISGPIGYSIIGHPTLPPGLKENLAHTIGTGPKVVFAPDFATYYIGRELGWRQLGFADPSNASDSEWVNSICRRADAAVLREWDPYETTQHSCTPYGLFCKYVLYRARQEKDIPEASKSWFARFGSKFTGGWHAPIKLEGFTEVGRFGMIRVLLPNRTLGSSPN